MAHHLRIGFFERFKGADTLLFEGDGLALLALSRVFRELSEHPSHQVALHELPFIQSNGVAVTASTSSQDHGIHRSDGSFSWKRSQEGWLTCSNLLQPLVKAESGHQYLRAAEDEVTPMVSIGEYGSALWHAGA